MTDPVQKGGGLVECDEHGLIYMQFAMTASYSHTHCTNDMI